MSYSCKEFNVRSYSLSSAFSL